MANRNHRCAPFLLYLIVLLATVFSCCKNSGRSLSSCEAFSTVKTTTPSLLLRRSDPLKISASSLKLPHRVSGSIYDSPTLMPCLKMSSGNRNSGSDEIIKAATNTGLIGDDSAYFSLQDQDLNTWLKFVVATGTVLVTLSYLWFLPIGPHWGSGFLSQIQNNVIHSQDPAATVFAMLTVFAVSHSGMASLRPYMEEIVGARAWRVAFACVSLPLALSCISYFVNHAHEGVQLWDFTSSATLHAFCIASNFVSFLLLYPSTFNLLEIAAVEKPQLHLWETGVIRITRHPQAWGQILWCTAHTLWLGSSVAMAASSMLVLHHVFSMWNGDRRLKERHGEAFDLVQAKTSNVPFAAILDGRQQLPQDYYKELLRPPYALVVGGTLAAYLAHPFMMAGAALLKW